MARAALLVAALACGLAAAADAGAQSLRASEIFSAAVRERGGEPLGRIDDLLLDTHGSRVDYAILVTPEGKRFPAPLTAFRPHGERLELDLERAALGGAAGFAAAGGAPSGYVALRGLLGREVKRAGGGHAGALRDVVIDFETGEVRYAIVDYDPPSAEAPLGVPLGRLELPAGDGPVILGEDP
ncbi:MAG TPA: hypothetical protein VF211_06785 [Burkholderiales bacterium]